MTAHPMAEIAISELEAIVETVQRCAVADFERPTALPGWSVEDLIRHMVGTAARQAEAYHRVRFGITLPPGDATVVGTAAELPPRLAAAAEHLAAGARGVDETPATLVPLPWAILPPPLAAFVILVEYGVHRHDLDLALGGSGILASEVADAMCDLIGLMLPSLAAPSTPPARAIRFEPSERTPVTLTWRDGSWSTSEEGEDPPAVIRGPSDAVALFVAGRIRVNDDRLDVEDPTGALRAFKQMFPGP